MECEVRSEDFDSPREAALKVRAQKAMLDYLSGRIDRMQERRREEETAKEAAA